MAKTVVGLFDDAAQAHNAVQELIAAGIGQNDINVLAGGSHSRPDRHGTLHDHPAEEGAMKGAVWGGVVGLLLGTGSFSIPGIGPVLAAGAWVTALESLLAGAGIGALAGGLIGALMRYGIPEQHAHYYAESVRRGSTLVVVHAPAAQAQPVVEILHRLGAVDLNERFAEYHRTGFRRFGGRAASDGHTAPVTSPDEAPRRGHIYDAATPPEPLPCEAPSDSDSPNESDLSQSGTRAA